ncbi:hypothetical protein E1262_12615 [Jiangella aurantiaca]|uniref:Uncharacterized protein n=1 Tax=Jiangella aurantiaca TaxID=2530373 RepID=A0A4R5ADW9_9ACTN|nr:hypothetical protein [Jiangella aurantiaca]TDD69480.1 hypothetical protein E1262_12615 [Jiangella aurantiaca]
MTRSTRTASLLGAAAALVLGLTACSGGGDSEYCDLLNSAQEDTSFADADPTDPEAMEEFNNQLQEVVDAAPDDLKGDWETFQSALEAMSDPEAAAEQDPEAATTAMENIEQHAQDECDIELG